MVNQSLLLNSDPATFLQYAFAEISQAVETAKHPFHNFWVSSLNLDNSPELRTVILRKLDLSANNFLFHSDVRSKKIPQFKHQPKVEALFYAKELKLQLRFKCKVTCHHQNSLSKQQIIQMKDNSKQCYLYPIGPGEALEVKNKEYQSPALTLKKEEIDRQVSQNMSVIECNFYQLDLLWLHHKGHIRILYNWLDENGTFKTEPTHQFIVA